jgi:hypothetical protein
MNAETILLASKEISLENKYDSAPISVGNTFETYCSYVKPQITPKAMYNVIAV